MNKIKPRKLLKLYIKDGIPGYKIAKEMGMAPETIYKRIREWGFIHLKRAIKNHE
jgi:biotin operon repressor